MISTPNTIPDASIASNSYRQEHSKIKGMPTRVLRTFDVDALRERYWHLWLCNRPHFGLPRSWRAPLDQSPYARKLRAVRKNEMLRIEALLREKQQPLRGGTKYESIFGTSQSSIVSD